jgi:putative peptidoglycan lipid II flippase
MAAALYLASVYGIRALAGGVVIGSALSIAVQWRILWQHRRFFRLGVDFRQPLFRGVLRLAFPLLIGMAGAKLDDIVDRIFASRLPAGSISGLTYAMRLIDFPREILVFAFATVLFPYFSRLVSQGSSQEYADRLIDSLRIAFFVLFPISIGLALLGEPIVRLVFERGAFGEQSVRSTVPALLLYTPTLWALGLTSTMIAGFVAIKDTRTPVVAGFARLGVKIALVFAFIGAFQNAGIALATSISHVLKLVLFLFVLPAWVRAGRYGRLFRGLLGAVAASTVMAGALLLLAPLGERLGPGSTILLRLGTVGGMAGAGLVVYLAAAWVFARRELAETLRVARQGVSTILSGAARRDMPDGD